MTVADLGARLGGSELAKWRALAIVRAEEVEAERQKAERQRKR